jgi:hypothetical protein
MSKYDPCSLLEPDNLIGGVKIEPPFYAGEVFWTLNWKYTLTGTPLDAPAFFNGPLYLIEMVIQKSELGFVNDKAIWTTTKDASGFRVSEVLGTGEFIDP